MSHLGQDQRNFFAPTSATEPNMMAQRGKLQPASAVFLRDVIKSVSEKRNVSQSSS